MGCSWAARAGVRSEDGSCNPIDQSGDCQVKFKTILFCGHNVMLDWCNDNESCMETSGTSSACGLDWFTSVSCLIKGMQGFMLSVGKTSECVQTLMITHQPDWHSPKRRPQTASAFVRSKDDCSPSHLFF